MDYVDAAAMKEFFLTFPPHIQAMYKEQMEKAQQTFRNEKDHSIEELQKQANFLQDIKMRIEIGYEAKKSLAEREEILKGIFSDM
ncbi:hypothetical protein WDR10_11220 [Kurthia gibsonii]|uniref:hypothetical protein n=1 Tax=Kurthia gibsonii TaxID=33946 RepID=UPI0030CCC064